MIKGKIFTPVIMILVIIMTGLLFTGCFDDDSDTYNSFMASENLYFDGEQTISISPSEYNETSTFLDTITKDDVKVSSGILSGKTVKSVEYVDENKINVTFSGKVTAKEPQDERDRIGKITISHKATKNGKAGSVYVKVNYHPKMTCFDAKISNTTYRSVFTLPYGSFISENVNTTFITVPGYAYTVAITDEGGLQIEVSNFTPFEDDDGQKVEFPVAKIDANVTTFNKVLYVEVGKILAEYDLV